MPSMAKYINSFSLLDDEEEDVINLVNNISKKADNSLKDNDSSQSVHNESGRSGSRDGNYSRDGSWGAIEDDGVAIDYGGHQQRESNIESTGVEQTEKENDGWQDVTRSNRKGYANNGGSFGDGQWKSYKSENISHRRGRRAHGEQFNGNDASNGQKRRYNTGNRGFSGDRRVNGDHQVKDNEGGDGQTRYRKGNQGYGVDRRGNGDNQVQGNDDGDAQMRYRNGNRSYSDQAQDGGSADGKNRYRNGNRGGYGGGRRGHYRDQVKDNDAGSGEQNGEGEVFEEHNWGGEETTYRSRNWNYNGERRGRGGYRGRGGRGRSEFRRTGSDEVKEASNADDEHNVNAEHVNGSGGDAAAVLNDSEVVAAEEEKNASEVVSGDVTDPKDLGHQRKENEEARQKKKEEEEKEAALMTLDQYYEKLHSEKRKLLELEAQKTEVRRVAIDKDFERMHLFERKQDDIDDRWFSIRKPKMERVKGQVSEASKIADEVNDNDSKLKTEEIPNVTVKVEKEKGRKPVVVEAHEIFTSAFRPRRFGGRGGGGGGRGDHRDGGRGRAGGHSRGEQVGRGTEHGEQRRFRDRINESVPQTYSDAPAPRRRRAPLPRPEDFPELAPGASPEGV